MSPLVGVLTLIAITVVLAAVVAVGANSFALTSSAPTAGFELSADGEQSTITLEHAGGDPIDVDELTVTVEINGDALEEQPPIPFVGAKGFHETPAGPFNDESDPIWRAGERASLRVASTNEPQMTTGDTVTVTLSVDGQRIASLEETVT